MAKPSKLPEWDTTQVNSTEPDATHKSEGWLAPAGIPEKPPLESFNWWQNNVYLWLQELNDKGIVTYDAATDYTIGALAVGSDLLLYRAYIANGPSASIINPVGDLTGAWKAYGVPQKDILRLSRSRFSWVNNSQISIAGGAYQHFGTTEQIVIMNDVTITLSILSPGTSNWQYIYIDDSAVVTAGNNIITSTELTNDTTAPTYSNSKNGWYNGDDRCIFAVYIDSGGIIENFMHDANYVAFATEETSRPAATLTAGLWTPLTHRIPAFSTGAIFTIVLSAMPLGTLSWRANSVGSHIFATNQVAASTFRSTTRVITSSAQVTDILLTAASSPVTTGLTNGWFFPVGM